MMNRLRGYVTYEAASLKAAKVSGVVKQLMDGTYIVLSDMVTYGSNGVWVQR